MISKRWSSCHFLNHTFVLFIAGTVVDYSDDEWAAGAFGDVISFADILEGNLEFIAAGAGVVEGLVVGIEVEVFYLYLVVNFPWHWITFIFIRSLGSSSY